MSLEAGQRLGPYEILEPIGKGGMGEVYRARDTKLDRDVAIKILPEEFANDEERLARFEREAKLLASLNHPNIASIYGFESSALVLELVEGPTLAERIQQGSIPVDEAIAIAKQIAEALEAGHEAGVIHRDLKPANLKVREDGTVKVLDYGLAKALEGDATGGPDSELSQSPTLTRQGTHIGVILGTAAYMSPEQARGKRLDRRTDIWAFGVVLYEMLTGRRLFEAEDVSLTLAEVMKSEPDWNALPDATPPKIRELLGRCLRKDPARRLRDIGDAGLDIEEAMREPGAAAAAKSGPAKRPQRAIVMAATAALLAGLTAGYALRSDRPRAPSTEGPSYRLSVDAGPRLYLDRPSDPLLAMSPDGSLLAYGIYGGFRPQEIYVRRLTELEAHPLQGTRYAKDPFFSPDGEWLAFFSFPDNQLIKVPLGGGQAAHLARAPFFWGGSWDIHDNIYYSSLGNIYRVPSSGGEPELLLARDSDAKEGGYRYPVALPEGGALLLTVGAGSDDFNDASIALFDLKARELRTLVDRGTHARFVPTGHLVYMRDGQLMAVTFNSERREVVGSAVPVIEETSYTPSGGGGQYAFSDNGTLVYVPPGPTVPIARVVRKSRDGTTTPLGVSVPHLLSLNLSPNGNELLMFAGEPFPRAFVYDLRREVLRSLSPRGTETRHQVYPIWSLDGQRISFGGESDIAYRIQIYEEAADGTGAREQFPITDFNAYPAAWTPDGASLLFVELTLDGTDVGLLSSDGQQAPQWLLNSSANEEDPSVSPDGRWLSYTSDESGQREVYVQRFPELGAKSRISVDGGFSPRWSRSGRELFYRDGTYLMTVAVDTRGDLSAARPQPLFEDSVPPWLSGGYDVSIDDESFITMDIAEPGATTIVVVVDWFEELKRLVPTED